jgi:hypothetical protein
MQNFQRRLFYAPVSSEDNVIIENPRDMHSATHYFEVNSKSKLSISPWANRCEPTAIWLSPAMNQTHQAPCILLYSVLLRLALHIEGIGNQDKRPETTKMKGSCAFQSLILF